ncbi:MAG: hypothetical protein GXO97_02035 [Nitrospirae bacterium]|nr:hypothetical protein [Nitrospirota bacterium]
MYYHKIILKIQEFPPKCIINKRTFERKKINITTELLWFLYRQTEVVHHPIDAMGFLIIKRKTDRAFSALR